MRTSTAGDTTMCGITALVGTGTALDELLAGTVDRHHGSRAGSVTDP